MSLRYTYSNLSEYLYTKVLPLPIEKPKMLLFNDSLAKRLNADSWLGKNEATEIFSGNKLLENSRPIAQAYAGHQFGHFNVLGDGRAILLGEIDLEGRLFDIQLKGSGPTPYSRRGDGRATVYSMLREYLISEAMYALDIPTSRSLAVIKGDTRVYRESVHNAGVLTRIAASHIRVGTFEYAARLKDPSILEELFNYTVKRHYPEVLKSENPALELLQMVIKKQIDLVVKWMGVGFIHGVMNTDNTGIAGETFDYGPCAFMNNYDPATVFSSIDHQGRYAYKKQPGIIQWNLMRFAETLLPLINPNIKVAVEMAQSVFNNFEQDYKSAYKRQFLLKIGIEKQKSGDEQLLEELLAWMYSKKADFTNTFRGLLDAELHSDVIFSESEFLDWKSKWRSRVSSIDNLNAILSENNAAIIARNHIVEESLLKASKEDDFSLFNEFLESLQKPYSTPENKKFQKPPESEQGYQTFCGT